MEFTDITNLREIAARYFSLIQFAGVPSNNSTSIVKEFHDVISKFDIMEIRNVLSRYNVNQTDIISTVESLITIFKSIKVEIENNLFIVTEIDKDVDGVLSFCADIFSFLTYEKKRLISLKKEDPTEEDEKACKFFSSLLEGKSDIEVENLLNSCFLKGLSQTAKKRRLDYMISHQPNGEIKGQLLRYKSKHQDIMQKQSLSVDTSIKNFSPFFYGFYYSALSGFLFEEGLLKEEYDTVENGLLFEQVISNAEWSKLIKYNEEKNNKTKWRCVIHMIAQIWIKDKSGDAYASYMNKSANELKITKEQLERHDTRSDFPNRLKKIIKKE